VVSASPDKIVDSAKTKILIRSDRLLHSKHVTFFDEHVPFDAVNLVKGIQEGHEAFPNRVPAETAKVQNAGNIRAHDSLGHVSHLFGHKRKVSVFAPEDHYRQSRADAVILNPQAPPNPHAVNHDYGNIGFHHFLSLDAAAIGFSSVALRQVSYNPCYGFSWQTQVGRNSESHILFLTHFSFHAFLNPLIPIKGIFGKSGACLVLSTCPQLTQIQPSGVNVPS
jgi:hypothetical protein